MKIEKSILTVKTTHTISTLGESLKDCNEIWVVFHGYGQLAEYFIRRFDVLDYKNAFVIAPEGMSKFYLAEFSQVGASWMTKHQREVELGNQKEYFLSIFDNFLNNAIVENKRINLLGFSQGVAAMIRFLIFTKLVPSKLILWAGEPPKELKSGDLDLSKTETHFVIGKNDQYYNQQVVEGIKSQFDKLTSSNAKLTVFDGEHEVTREVLYKLIH